MGLTPHHQLPSRTLTDSRGDCPTHLKHHPPRTLLLDPNLTPALFPLVKHTQHLCGASLWLYPLLLTLGFCVSLWQTSHCPDPYHLTPKASASPLPQGVSCSVVACEDLMTTCRAGLVEPAWADGGVFMTQQFS